MTENSREMDAATMLDGLNTSIPDTTATEKADGVLAQGRGNAPRRRNSQNGSTVQIAHRTPLPRCATG